MDKLRENPNMTKQEWDKYAYENCLFSAFTLQCHIVDNNTCEKLIEKNKDVFEYMIEKIMSEDFKKKKKSWRLNGKYNKRDK